MKQTFEAPLGHDDGYRNSVLADSAIHEMELFLSEDRTTGTIEWCVQDYVTHIGVWFDGDELSDYDGVYEIPAQALDLLEMAGFNVDEYREDL
jgi:hypothetical protein